ncbi:MAG: ribosome-associated translation inhibitor RaiA [Bacteroidia bacterium]|nr:ribosome-associated translation inhibitor RaiA [Bacteroidia bacterium]
MNTMKMQIQSPHFKASQALIDLVTEKVNTLEKIEHQIDRADVTLHLEHKGKTMAQSCHIRLSVKGKDLFAKINADSFDEAVNLCVDAVKRRLRKRKTKKMKHAIKEIKYRTA